MKVWIVTDCLHALKTGLTEMELVPLYPASGFLQAAQDHSDQDQDHQDQNQMMNHHRLKMRKKMKRRMRMKKKMKRRMRRKTTRYEVFSWGHRHAWVKEMPWG